METLLSFLLGWLAALALGDPESVIVHRAPYLAQGQRIFWIGLDKAERISGQPAARYSRRRSTNRHFFRELEGLWVYRGGILVNLQVLKQCWLNIPKKALAGNLADPWDGSCSRKVAGFVSRISWTLWHRLKSAVERLWCRARWIDSLFMWAVAGGNFGEKTGSHYGSLTALRGNLSSFWNQSSQMRPTDGKNLLSSQLPEQAGRPSSYTFITSARLGIFLKNFRMNRYLDCWEFFNRKNRLSYLSQK